MMRNPEPRSGAPRRLALVAATLVAVLGALPAAAEAKEYRFDVYYDDRAIGEHHWQIREQDGVTRVTSRARFEVKILFVPVYRYRHSAEERWIDGCLDALAAVTDDNGREQRVGGARQPTSNLAAFTRADETVRVPLVNDCAGSFAYWNPELLERPRLVNVQTGELVSAQFIHRGESSYLGERAMHYQLRAADLPAIDLWYRLGDRQWLGLETRRDGATLAYRLSSVEPLPPGSLDPHGPLEVPSI